ncbi:hypothetical protein ACLB2K_065543 [Fragaria x ananassa]
MASLGFDPGDPNKWYQSPLLGLIPTGYGGEIACNCSYYSTVGASYQRATHFTQPNHYPPPQHNYYTPPPPNFTQPHSYPPSHHFTPPNPYPPPLHFAQPNSYSPPPQSSHSGTLIKGHWLPLQFSCASQSQAQYYPSPHLQPTHSISPQPSPHRPSIPCYYTPHPNPNLQIHPSISPTSSHEPMVVHSHLWRAHCKQVALESTAATGGVKKPRHKRKELLIRKPLFQRLLSEITQGFKTELRLHSSGFEQPKTMANFSKPHDFSTTVVPHAIYRSIRVKDDMVSCCCEDIATNWLSQFSVVQFCILSEDAQILGCLVINGVSNTRMLVDFLLLLRSSFGSLDLQLAAELVMCGDARDACSMIDGNSMIDLVLWTAVIVGYYMHNGYSLEALELYSDKGWVGLLQHSITPPRVRLACAQSGNLCMGRSVHRYGIKLGLTVSNVSNLLVDLHAKCHIIRDARYIFVTTWDKQVLPWSSGSFGYSLNGFAYEALHLCLRMRSQSFQLAAFTVVRFLSACASCGFLLVYEESCFHGYVAMPNGKQLKAKTCDASLDGALGAPARTQAQLLNDVVQASHTWLLTSLIPCALLLSIMQVISTIAAALTQLTSEVPRHLNAKTSTHTAAQIVSPEMYHFA